MQCILDLDDTLAETTKCLGGDISKVSTLTLAHGADVFLAHYGEQSTLVTAGDYSFQYQKMDVLGITRTFRHVYCVKTPDDKHRVFEGLIEGHSPSEFFVIGDRLDAEIRAANVLGIPSIRMRIEGGKYFSLEPRSDNEIPTHTFSSFTELLQFLEVR